MKTENILIIIFVYFSVNVSSDCGTPAIPKFALLTNDQNQFIISSERYKEYENLTSDCYDSYYSVGTTSNGLKRIITCRNGEWLGSIRKCAIEKHPVEINDLVVSILSEDENSQTIILKENITSGCYKWNISTQSQIWVLNLEYETEFDNFKLSLFNELKIPLAESVLTAGTSKISSCSSSGVWQSKKYKGKYFDFQCAYLNNKSEITTNQIIVKAVASKHEEVEICRGSLTLYKIVENCGEPEKPLNSIVENFNGIYSVFRCHENFKLIGSKVVHCGHQGSWIEKFPRCVIWNCSLPAANTSDVIIRYTDKRNQYIQFDQISTTAPPGTRAIISCISKFSYISKQSSRELIKICKNGNWFGDEPNCTQDIGVISKGIRNTTVSDYSLDTNSISNFPSSLPHKETLSTPWIIMVVFTVLFVVLVTFSLSLHFRNRKLSSQVIEVNKLKNFNVDDECDEHSEDYLYEQVNYNCVRYASRYDDVDNPIFAEYIEIISE